MHLVGTIRSEHVFQLQRIVFLLLNINLFPGHLVELTSTEKITELQQYLMTRYTNKSFWVGSSDLENEGTFRWFYSGDLFSSDLWSQKPRDDNHCVRMDDSFLKFSADECDNKNYFICEVGPNLSGQGYKMFCSVHTRDLCSNRRQFSECRGPRQEFWHPESEESLQRHLREKVCGYWQNWQNRGRGSGELCRMALAGENSN